MPRSLAVLFVLGALIAGCGGDGGGDEGNGGGGGGGSAATEQGLKQGDGYRVAVPEGWRDVSDRLKGAAVNFDLVLAGEGVDGFSTNVNVIREETGETDLDKILAGFRDQVEALADDAGVGETEDRELGGQPAKTYTYELRREQPPAVRQRQVVAVHDGAVYTITLSAAEEVFDEQERIFQKMLDSWRWD